MAQKKKTEVSGKKKKVSSEDVETVISPDTSLGKFKSGYVLNNRFVIKKMLGRGGMGIVYEAWDKELEQDVAIKVLRAFRALRSRKLLYNICSIRNSSLASKSA